MVSIRSYAMRPSRGQVKVADEHGNTMFQFARMR